MLLDFAKAMYKLCTAKTERFSNPSAVRAAIKELQEVPYNPTGWSALDNVWPSQAADELEAARDFRDIHFATSDRRAVLAQSLCDPSMDPSGFMDYATKTLEYKYPHISGELTK